MKSNRVFRLILPQLYVHTYSVRLGTEEIKELGAKSRIEKPYQNKLHSARGNYEGSAQLQSRYNGRLYDPRGSYERKLQPQCNGQLCSPRENYEGSAKPMQSRCNGYVSTDESEYTTDDTDSEEEIGYPNVAGSMDRGNSAPLLNRCDSSEYSFAFEDEYSGTRGHSTASQELEGLYANGIDPRFVNTEAEMPPEAKSLMLSMVTSQEGILETKRHLRSTPVLDNLLGTATPECKLSDVNPELGKLTRMRFCNPDIIAIATKYAKRSLTHILR